LKKYVFNIWVWQLIKCFHFSHCYSYVFVRCPYAHVLHYPIHFNYNCQCSLYQIWSIQIIGWLDTSFVCSWKEQSGYGEGVIGCQSRSQCEGWGIRKWWSLFSYLPLLFIYVCSLSHTLHCPTHFIYHIYNSNHRTVQHHCCLQLRWTMWIWRRCYWMPKQKSMCRVRYQKVMEYNWKNMF
jgi:hypothetical protein